MELDSQYHKLPINKKKKKKSLHKLFTRFQSFNNSTCAIGLKIAGFIVWIKLILSSLFILFIN